MPEISCWSPVAPWAGVGRGLSVLMAPIWNGVRYLFSHRARQLALALALLSGCATPDYLLPGGYSSTYHKAMTQPKNVYPQQYAPSPGAISP